MTTRANNDADGNVQSELVRLKKENERLERENLEHAEDWAFCGLNPESKTAQGLVLRDQNRKLKAKLVAAEEVAKALADVMSIFDQADKVQGTVLATGERREAWDAALNQFRSAQIT